MRIQVSGICSLAKCAGSQVSVLGYDVLMPGPDCRAPARLLRARRERPRGCRAAEQRDERAAFQLVELHSTPVQPGRLCRISNGQASVSGCWNGFATAASMVEHRPRK